MSLHGDDRGVSEVLGGILLFGIVIALLVILQVAAVPGWNQQVEYEHNQRVQGDMSDLRDSFSRIAATGRAETSAIEAGVRYPARPFLLNPPAAEGRVSTSGVRTLTISNAQAVNDETDDHFQEWDGIVETRDLVFRPDYNEFRNAPLTIIGAGGVFYNQYSEASIVLGGQSFIQGDRISLTLLKGTIDEQTLGAVTVGATPVSAPTEHVTIQGRNETSLKIKINSDAPASVWEEVLTPQLDENDNDPNRYVQDFWCSSNASGTPCGELTVVLEPEHTYSLSLALVGLDGTGSTDPAYLTRIGAGTVTLPEGSATTFTVGARDKYNNPKAGLTVEWRDDSGLIGTTTTGEDGNTALQFDATGVTDEVTAWLDINEDGTETKNEIVTYTVETTELEDPTAGVGDNLNPAGATKFEVVEDIIIGGGQCRAGSTNADCRAYVTFKNQDSSTKTIDSIRVNVYVASQPGQASRERPVSLNITQDEFGDAPITIPNLQVRGDFVDASAFESVGPSNETSFTFRFYADRGGTLPYGVANGDFFVITVIFDDGTGAIYFLAPIKGTTPTAA